MAIIESSSTFPLTYLISLFYFVRITQTSCLIRISPDGTGRYAFDMRPNVPDTYVTYIFYKIFGYKTDRLWMYILYQKMSVQSVHHL